MANWQTFTTEAPPLAARVEARLRAHRHHVMATLRADGSPRVSGTEVVITDDELFLGSMWGARKAVDLARDPRVAVHTNPGDGSMDGGDARLSAVASEVQDDHPAKLAVRAETGPPEPFHLFALDLSVVSLVEVVDDTLLTHVWRPGLAVATHTST